MGNDLTNGDELDKEEDVQNEKIKYGLISKKCGEKSNNDNYIISPDIKLSVEDRSIEYSLFGIFDGHNSNYISKYLSENINKFFEKGINEINNDNYKTVIEDIFKEIDKDLRNKQNSDKDDEKNLDNADIEVNDKDKENIKNSIKNSEEIPEEFKEIDDNEIEDLLLFQNMFNYDTHYFNHKNNINYIGSSASLVLINQENIIKIELGITKCFLLDNNGKILKSKKQKDSKESKDSKKEHKFNNNEEKKRIKRFNKDIDYEALKINPYLPTTRSFGFFKYKANELLNEENQIISCIPDIEKYDSKNVDYIFFITGLEIDSKCKKKLSEEINKLSKDQNEENKYSKIIEELIKYFKKENSKNKIDNNKKQNIWKNNFNLYFGKDNLEEENIYINELDEDYYKDITELNKNKDIKNNITCILIKLNKNKEEIKNENKIEEVKEEAKEEVKKENQEENKVSEKIENKEEPKKQVEKEVKEENKENNKDKIDDNNEKKENKEE